MNLIRKRILVTRANSLMFAKGEVLADFEKGLITEVHSRPCLAATTPVEWTVIEGALAAMLAAPRQDLTDAGLAA